jgi:hypothetical protein
MDSFLSGAKDTFDNRVNKEKPFETLFTLLGPAVLWGISWPLGLLATVADFAGFSLGGIGKYIDEALDLNDGKNLKQITEEKLKLVSENIVDGIVTPETMNSWKKSEEEISRKEAVAMLKDIKELKGHITNNDVFVALAYSKNNGLVKQARGKLLTFLFGASAVKPLKKGIVAMLWRLLVRAAKYLGLFVVAGGVTKVVKDELGFSKKLDDKKVNNTLYKNTKGDVLKTIVEFLNAEFDFDYKGKVLSFSEMYKQMSGQNIETSTQMGQILESIRLLNGGEYIENLNGWEAFKGPLIEDMYKVFLPNALVSEEIIQPVSQEKQISKRFPSVEKEDQKIVNLFLELKGRVGE